MRKSRINRQITRTKDFHIMGKVIRHGISCPWVEAWDKDRQLFLGRIQFSVVGEKKRTSQVAWRKRRAAIEIKKHHILLDRARQPNRHDPAAQVISYAAWRDWDHFPLGQSDDLIFKPLSEAKVEKQ